MSDPKSPGEQPLSGPEEDLPPLDGIWFPESATVYTACLTSPTKRWQTEKNITHTHTLIPHL